MSVCVRSRGRGGVAHACRKATADCRQEGRKNVCVVPFIQGALFGVALNKLRQLVLKVMQGGGCNTRRWQLWCVGGGPVGEDRSRGAAAANGSARRHRVGRMKGQNPALPHHTPNVVFSALWEQRVKYTWGRRVRGLSAASRLRATAHACERRMMSTAVAAPRMEQPTETAVLSSC